MFWLEAILGLALAIAPFALGYRDNSAAMWGSVVIGLLVMAVSVYKAYTKKPERWEGWVNVVAGIVAVLLPFIFGFSTLATALWATVLIGILIAALSGIALFTTSDATA